MAAASQLSAESVELVEFQSLKSLSDNDAVEALVKDSGVVYVTAITRDGCSGCTEQKPLFHNLARKMSSDLAEKVHFSNVHVRYADGDKTESWASKKMFRHAAYPTYLVHVRSTRGILEVFRAVYPTMEELEKQTRESLELAKFYQDEA